jgi:hypothetical protein
MLNDESALKIHTDADDIVWFAPGINPAENSHKKVDDFLDSPVTNKIGLNVRLLGVPQNAELIVKLCARKKSRKIASVSIAGPNMCESVLELADPLLTFRRMRDAFVAASCGGWHEIAENEILIYSLVSRIRNNPDWFDLLGRAFYETHPTYKALTLINGLSHKDTAQLMALIIDPRWYVDRRRPDNPNKLMLYLGLTPKTQRRVSTSEHTNHRGRDLRCAMVLNCWKTQDPAVVDFDAPENFLWRIWRKNGSDIKGDLRASQAFVGYLQANWLNAASSRKGAKDGLFLPDKFFKTPEEKVAYLAKLV